MKFLFIILPILISCDAFSDKEQWMQFKEKYEKNYKFRSDEKQKFLVFQKNLRKIEEHNAKADQGLYTFRLGVNKFADLTSDQFSKQLQRSKMMVPTKPIKTVKLTTRAALPTEVDWRTVGAITEVKDQGDCESCWAFSATGGIEAAYFLKTGKLVSVSEKNLMDCDRSSSGCDGGLISYAFDWVKEHGGIQTENDYPYKAAVGKCRFNKTKTIIPIVKYVNLPTADEKSLLVAAAARPVSAAIEATEVMQLYESGIMYDKTCGSSMDDLNHGVLVIGYGSDPVKGDYWLVKNSWGADWGMDGYLQMSRNKHNQCGIATLASYPIA